jgi:hypothetical protein
MRVGSRAAAHTPFEKVKHQLEVQLRREEVKKRRETYIAGLKKKTKVRIDPHQFSAVVADVQDAYSGLASNGGVPVPPLPAE